MANGSFKSPWTNELWRITFVGDRITAVAPKGATKVFTRVYVSPDALQIQSKCSECRKIFGSMQLLSDHVADFHPLNPQDLLCGRCGKKFTTRTSRETHQRGCTY